MLLLLLNLWIIHPLGDITNRLQERGVDIIDVYDDVSSVIKDKKSTRKNIDKEFRVTFEQVERVAAKNGTQTSMPRIAKSQVIRDNTECDSLKIITDEYLQFLSLIN